MKANNCGILISFNFLLLHFYRNDWFASNCFFTIQLVLSINVNSPIRKLLVLIEQSFFVYLVGNFFDRAVKASRYVIRNKMEVTTFVVNSYVPVLFFFKKSHFHWRQSFRKGIDINATRNVEHLVRLVLIIEE